MIKLSKSDIYQRSTSRVFERGMRYYQEGRVQAISYDENTRRFRGTISGTRIYRSEVRFDENGQIESTSCTCAGFNEYWGDCKHVVALLLALRETGRQGALVRMQARQAGHEIFDFFQRPESVEKIPLQLEITYELSSYKRHDGEAVSYFSFRIGVNKLYVIKNIPKFLEQIDSRMEIEFGKGFTYDPYYHTFSEQDWNILAFIREIYEIQNQIDHHYEGVSSGIFFKDKRLCLPSALTKRFLKLLEDRRFRAYIQGALYEDMEITKDLLPVGFALKSSQNDFVLEVKAEDPLEVLSPDGEYVLSGSRIYKLSGVQKENLTPFLLVISGKKEKQIRFANEEKERFISEILPFAQKIGNVIIEEKVDAEIIKKDLKPEIYLDKEGPIISAQVSFIYGEYKINPFSNRQGDLQVGSKILLRDMVNEKNVLDVLDRYSFKVHIGRVYLRDEEEIYHFLTEGLQQLQKYGDVFYSDSFKKMEINSRILYYGSIHYDRQMDYLTFSFDMEGVEEAEFFDILSALREKRKYYRLGNGSFLSLEDERLSSIAGLMEYLDVKREDISQNDIRIPKYRALYLETYLQETELSSIQTTDSFQELIQRIRKPERLDLNPPSFLHGQLREYQKFGFQWLKALSYYGLGGILADDMGLGKTLQMLTLLLSDKEEKGRKPSLVVAPTSLIYNWQAEVEKFTPDLQTLVISGSREERLTQMTSMKDVDVVITSYPLIRRDIQEYKGCCFRYCVLDEAQHIKNPNSQGARAVKEIQAESRFAMTGTPMENALSELWSIFDFIMPGYLFSHSKFALCYETPITKQQDQKAVADLSRHIRPFILRRLKADVLKELPEKIEHKMITDLTEEQKKIYLVYREKIKREIEEEIRQKGFAKSHIKILAGLTRLRQICCHPGMFLEDFRGESGKMQLLEELIEESMESGHRILLFSQFTSMLKIIQQRLEELKIHYLYLDGSTSTQKRMQLVKAFNEGEEAVFLISLKAGGTGLNLTGADTVVHFDPWWNPAVEDQASDRAHRIGQKNVVHVMKLITRGTIEEKIYELQQRKRQLVDIVIKPGDTIFTKISEEEVKALFDV